MKKWITFTKPQFAWLEHRAEELGISMADLVRRIIDEHRLRLKESDIEEKDQ